MKDEIDWHVMTRNLTPEDILAFQRDGVILITEAVDKAWVERLLQVVEAQLIKPSTWANDANPGADKNRLFTDRYQWRVNPEIRSYIYESGVARLAGQAMASTAVRFYFDHLLVKEPGTATVTPWHQDVPYWPVHGKQICSVWLALTDTTVEQSAMEFVRGSHASGKYYMPEVFGDRDNHPSNWQRDGIGEPVPAIQENRQAYDIVGWDMQAGDAVLFSAWTLHWAPGNSSLSQRRAVNSTRWLGDDAVWYPHQGADPTVTQDDVSLTPGEPVHDDNIFPLVWPR
ncbi:MAG: phytanoyl-CoA dioxygenase family protein [Woeseiaceae bacterium]